MQVDKGKFRKTVTGPFTGHEFEIRRIGLREYMQEIGMLPSLTTESTEERLRKLSDDLKAESKADPELERKSIRFFLERGVVSPKVWFGPEAKCPDNMVQCEDLAGDAVFLAAEISSFSFEMPGLKSMDKFFREPGSNHSGSGGEEIREAPLVDPAAGDSSEPHGDIVI